MPIIWRQQMSVGNTIIDDEHKYLFCLINTVELSLKTKEAADLLDVAMEQLVQYTADHFKREEMVQLKIKYPYYAQHKMEHQSLMETLEKIWGHLKERNAQAATAELEAQAKPEMQSETPEPSVGEPVSDGEVEYLVEEDPEKAEDDLKNKDINELIELLRSWIIDHVLETDMKMKSFLERYPANYM